MPSKSASQQRLAGLELSRKRSGKKPVSDMGSLSTAQLTDFASTKASKLPETVKAAKNVTKAVKKAKKGKT